VLSPLELHALAALKAPSIPAAKAVRDVRPAIFLTSMNGFRAAVATRAENQFKKLHGGVESSPTTRAFRTPDVSARPDASRPIAAA
jgi:hypothetical protein